MKGPEKIVVGALAGIGLLAVVLLATAKQAPLPATPLVGPGPGGTPGSGRSISVPQNGTASLFIFSPNGLLQSDVEAQLRLQQLEPSGTRIFSTTSAGNVYSTRVTNLGLATVISVGMQLMSINGNAMTVQGVGP
jgi:hypothetical protein